MITTPTTFVLGAGASIPYGFPSGESLVGNVINILERPHFFHYFGFEEMEINRFASDLKLANPSSIDFFLENRMEFSELGKFAIFLCINQCESERELLIDQTKKGGIYEYVFRIMTKDCRSLSDNQVNFITFNYDRSLEQFLYRRLSALRGRSEEQIVNEFNNIQILHFHGSLGHLPWQKQKESEVCLSYQPRDIQNPTICEDIFRMSKNISIIPDTDPNYWQIEKAKLLLKSSTNIIFIGFGFHSINMVRLGLDSFPRIDVRSTERNDKEIRGPNIFQYRGSSYKMMKSEIEAVNIRWRIFFPEGSNKYKGLDFLREEVLLD